jgi:hypothetical protein
MPAATTHVAFAQDVLSRLSQEQQKELAGNLGMFYLGSQGPDLLFFTHFSMGRKSLKRYGNMLHNASPLPFLSWMEQHADTPALRCYMKGMLCHYAMDSTLHPLIDDEAERQARRSGELHGICHVRIEAELDVYSLAQKGRTIADYDVWRWLKISHADARTLGSFYHRMFQEVYKLNLPEKELQNAPREIVQNTHLLAPGEKKYAFVVAMENRLRQPHGISALMLNDKGPCSILNKEHRPYVNLKKPEGIDTSSYQELYDESMALALHLLQGFDPASITANFSGIPTPQIQEEETVL